MLCRNASYNKIASVKARININVHIKDRPRGLVYKNECVSLSVWVCYLNFLHTENYLYYFFFIVKGNVQLLFRRHSMHENHMRFDQFHKIATENTHQKHIVYITSDKQLDVKLVTIVATHNGYSLCTIVKNRIT